MLAALACRLCGPVDRGMALGTALCVLLQARMLAAVRNRQGLVAGLEPFDGARGRLHLIHWSARTLMRPAGGLLWELEPWRSLLVPNALPSGLVLNG